MDKNKPVLDYSKTQTPQNRLRNVLLGFLSVFTFFVGIAVVIVGKFCHDFINGVNAPGPPIDSNSDIFGYFLMISGICIMIVSLLFLFCIPIANDDEKSNKFVGESNEVSDIESGN